MSIEPEIKCERFGGGPSVGGGPGARAPCPPPPLNPALPKFEVSDFVDFSLHGISTTAQKQCMFIIHTALAVAERKTNLIECGI